MKQKDLDQLMAQHERWLKDRAVGAQLKLVDEDLRGFNLSGRRLFLASFENVDLSSANLQNTRLDDATLTRVRFCEANMVQADLTDAEINDTDFTNANLTGLQISGLVNAINVKFDGAIMDEAFFVKSTLTDSSFKNVSLKSANFKRAYLDQCSLQDSHLEGVDFSYAFLIDVDLRGCNIKDAIFERTRMDLIHVYGLIGKAAKTENFPVSTDFSEAGDNSDIREIEDRSLMFMKATSR